MRLLPRLARGTWLLAAVTWAGGCVFGWYVLPPVPRGVARLPGNQPDELVGFGPNCATALVRRLLPHRNADPAFLYALDLIDTANGRCVATVVDGTHYPEILGTSRNGQEWLIGESTEMAENRLIQLDLGTRAADVIPLTTTEMEQIPEDRLSPDGRIVAICKPPAEAEAGDAKKGGLVLWDTIAKKRLAFLPGLEPPFAFSDDGRSLAVAVTPDTTGHLAIVDLGTLKIRETKVPISSNDPRPGCLSDDGSYFARFVVSGQPPFHADEVNLVCWNVATGRVVVRQWVAQLGINMRAYGAGQSHLNRREL